ncbi:MAG: oxidoreductase domain protein [Paenibacillus sp.]|jgi:scyllo-inositol 2-dehydrogenase (NADP+)|nr:oxidoreductase domain protein [Paenibacillus sp.]
MTINVGLIGYGLSGSIFHAPLIEYVKGLHLRAVVSSDAIKVYRDYPEVEVYPDVDSLLLNKTINVIVISSPNTTHHSYARKAILAGKHVVVEKPFTVTSEEADELIELARAHKVVLTVYHNRRWDNDFLTVRSLLETNMLGSISTYEAHFDRFRPAVQRRWREQDLPGSGILYDLGSHLIDQALSLFGKPQTVFADLRAEREGAEATDYFHLVLGYEKSRVILHSGSLVKKAGPRFMLHGDKGSFIKYGLDPQEGQLKQGLRPGDPGWGEDSAGQYGQLSTEVGGLSMQAAVETLPGRYQTFYEKLAESLQSGRVAPVPAEEARAVIRVIECALQSHQERRTVDYT